jgi:hypothetical protein
VILDAFLSPNQNVPSNSQTSKAPIFRSRLLRSTIDSQRISNLCDNRPNLSYTQCVHNFQCKVRGQSGQSYIDNSVRKPQKHNNTKGQSLYIASTNIPNSNRLLLNSGSMLRNNYNFIFHRFHFDVSDFIRTKEETT